MSLAFSVRESLARWEEPVFQITDRLFSAFEAFQVVLAKEHHFNDNDDLWGVLLKSHESLFHVFTEFHKCRWPISTKDLDHLSCELKRCLLELHTFSWSMWEEESKVNMHKMAVDIDQNITIMSIFDLQDIT